MNLKQKVVSGLAWSAGGRLVAQLLTWCITIVIIRLLSPEDYGLMTLAGVFVAFLALLNELGLGAAVVQRKDIDLPTLRSLFGLVLLVSGLFYLIMFFSAPLISGFYEEPRLVLLVQVLALEFLLNGFSVIPRSLLLREMKFRPIAVVDFISAISGSIATLVLALMGYGVWSLVWGMLMIRIVSTIGFNIAQPFFYLPRASFKGLGAFFSFGGYVTLGRVFWYLYSRTDTLIIGKVLGKELLGFYSIGLMLAALPMDKVVSIIIQVAFPAFSSVQSDLEVVGRYFLKAIRVMSFISFPVLWGISSISPEIIHVFLGDKWIQAVVPMQIIAIIIPLRMVSNVMSTAVFGVGRADVSFYLVVVPFVLMPVAFFVGSYWGLLGVSLAWIIVFPLIFSLQLMLTIKILKVSFVSVLKTMQMPFLSALVMYVGVYLVKSSPLLTLHAVLDMLMLIISGAVIYSAITITFNRNGLQEVRNLIKK